MPHGWEVKEINTVMHSKSLVFTTLTIMAYNAQHREHCIVCKIVSFVLYFINIFINLVLIKCLTLSLLKTLTSIILVCELCDSVELLQM